MDCSWGRLSPGTWRGELRIMHSGFFSFFRPPRAVYAGLVLLAMVVVFADLYSGRQALMESPAARLAEKHLGESPAVREAFGAPVSFELVKASVTEKQGVFRKANYTFAVSGIRNDGYVQLLVLNENGKLRVAQTTLNQ